MVLIPTSGSVNSLIVAKLNNCLATLTSEVFNTALKSFATMKKSELVELDEHRGVIVHVHNRDMYLVFLHGSVAVKKILPACVCGSSLEGCLFPFVGGLS